MAAAPPSRLPLASMGPELKSSGKQGENGWGRGGNKSFNGAGAQKLRKTGLIPLSLMRCMNSLQWGRSSKAPENVERTVLGASTKPLQWGRSSKAPENGGYPVVTPSCFFRLQWGRSSKAPENVGTLVSFCVDMLASMGPELKSSGKLKIMGGGIMTELSFNGAGAQKLRKTWIAAKDDSGIYSSFNGAGAQKLRKTPLGIAEITDANLASMGPELKSSGKLNRWPCPKLAHFRFNGAGAQKLRKTTLSWCRPTKRSSWLQWGRSSKAPEN